MQKKLRHRVAYGILSPLLTAYFMIFQGFRPRRFKAEKRNQPYLILGNHALASDPILMAASFKQTIYFVASDMIFSIPFLSKIITFLVAPIPKSKYKSDMQTIRSIKKMVKSGGSIGIFPEGNATFSGETMWIPPSTAKLVKLLKIPVVFHRLEGSYFIKPRWAKAKRKGKMIGYVHSVLEVEDYKDMSVEALSALINERLYVNHYDWQRQQMIPYKGKHNSEDIESTFFMCPNCSSYESLQTHHDTITCSECARTFTLDNYGFLQGDVDYETPLEWFKAQRKHFVDYLNPLNQTETIFSDDKERLYLVTREKNKTFQGIRDIVLNKQALLIKDDTETKALPLHELSVAVQQKNRLIVHHNSSAQTYYFIAHPKRNAYKYVLAIALINETGAY